MATFGHTQFTFQTVPGGPQSDEATSAHSSGYGSQLCLGQRGGMVRAFDEQEELSSTTEEDNGEEPIPIAKPEPGHFPSPAMINPGLAMRNFSKLPLDNSTSFSEYDAHLLETSMISIGSKSSFIEDEGKINNNPNCDQDEL